VGWEPLDPNFWTWNVNSWDPSTHNIDEDPNFIAGFYLDQPVAGWLGYSPCVDAGSDLAGVLGMDIYNTRIDGVNDLDVVDMGYHYDNEGLPRHHLTVTVVEDAGDPGIHGYVEPNSAIAYEGFDNEVQLTAYPDPNYRVRAWHGTDDDSSTEPNNTVTLTGDIEVTVEFERIPEYQLTVSVLGGHGTFIIDPVQASYLDGTTVTLTAFPEPDYYVDGWYYDTGALVSVSPSFGLVMDSNKVINVRFTLPEIIHVSGGGDALPGDRRFPQRRYARGR